MNRMTWLTASLLVAALAGCGGGVTSTTDGGAGQSGGAGGAAAGGHAGAGAAGTNGAAGAAGGHAGAGVAGTNGAAGGHAGAGVAGTNGAAGGHAGAGVAGTNGAAGATGGHAGAGVAGTNGAAGGHAGAGIAGTNGAAGAGGAAVGGHAGGGAGGGTVVCTDQGVCDGDSCQTACGTDGKTTFCTCLPAGNTMQFSCTTFACSRDAGPTPFPNCPADVTNQPDCDLTTDNVCATACAAQKHTECACLPHGGGGNGRWMCGAPTTCQ